jgi:hypothetical protein
VAEEADGALRRDRRRAERAGHHSVERLPQVGPPCRLLGPGLHHVDAGQPQLGHRLPEEQTGALAGLEQGHFQFRPGGGQHQAGKPAAAAEIEDTARRR